ncbi:hypothetical protein ACFVZC_36635 [Streptomyces marokkonensis]|uniref:Uncharacterized protein n=1 Tax=Streptomyces marokkonensis TaxID=324855 RepID=A0ABW6QHX8_9ACTN|nr:hypothetical protein [Streptomyces marokkonensis]
MTTAFPRTVRAVDTAHLLDLAQEAAMHSFSQRLGTDSYRLATTRARAEQQATAS